MLRLSDLFEQSAADKRPCLECETLVLNINYGHNRELMEKCRRLKEYAIFVDMVRKNLTAGAPLEEAVTRAADTCIDQGILEDLLKKQKAEVVRMALESVVSRNMRGNKKKRGYEEGVADGARNELEHGICQLITTLQGLNISAVLILYISFQYNVSHFCIKIKCVSFVTGNLHTLFYTPGRLIAPRLTLNLRNHPAPALSPTVLTKA